VSRVRLTEKNNLTQLSEIMLRDFKLIELCHFQAATVSAGEPEKEQKRQDRAARESTIRSASVAGEAGEGHGGALGRYSASCGYPVAGLHMTVLSTTKKAILPAGEY